MKNKKIIFLALVFLGLLFVTSFLVIKEPFQTEEEVLTQQINAIMTQFSDVICPALKVILDSYKIPDDEGDSGGEGPVPSEEKSGASQEIIDKPVATTPPPNDKGTQLKALRKFEKDLGGPAFPCPTPEDPIQLPADITKRTFMTLSYLNKELQRQYEELIKGLNNCEGFQNICPPPIGESKDPPPPPTLNPPGCVPPNSVPPVMKSMILRQRFESLQKLLQMPIIPPMMAKVKILTQQLLEAKKKAENNELRPNCPDMDKIEQPAID